MIIIADGRIIKRAQPSAAKRILKAGFPPVTLLITRTPSLLDWLPAATPVILTVGKGDSWNDLKAQAARLSHLAILRKPLIYDVLRNTVHRFHECQPLERSHPMKAHLLTISGRMNRMIVLQGEGRRDLGHASS